MDGQVLLVLGAAAFALAYRLYGRFLSRVFGLDSSRPTPAHAQRDGVDFEPAHRFVLFGHHFASIAGAGPIVGPILASYFGWGAVVLWLLLGAIFVGGVHDLAAMAISIRERGRSIAGLIDGYVGYLGRQLFLVFSLAALILVVAVFAGMVADTFVQTPAVATSSILFIAMAPVFGWLVYRHGLSLRTGSFVFVPLVFLSVAVGVWFPLDLHGLFGLDAAVARKVWVWALMVYAAAASVLPVWLLLQPRDYLNAYLLYAMMAFGVLGILVFRPGIELPAFAGWSAVGFGGRSTPIFPLLFVTVACGACSGFHSLVASGTTSKQLDREKDALPIGYGGMLIEGVLGFVALITVAYLSREQLGEQLAAAKGAAPVLFARGLATFGARLGVPPEIGMAFVSLSVSAFLMTTLDTATRLARFTLQELVQPMGGTGGDELSVPRQVFANKHAATAVVVLASAWLAFTDAQRIWPVFGASNQLLAALALLVATLWLIRHQARRAWVTFFPMIFMLAVSGTGLAQLARRELCATAGKGNAALGVIAAGLVVLSILLVVLAARSVRRELRART